MKAKPEYQQTTVGVIPADWATTSIVEAAPKIIDYRGRTPRKLGMEWGGGDIPALSARNVKMGFIDFNEECNFGSESLYKRWMTNGDAACGDIVFTTEAPLGNVALVPDDRRYILSQRTLLLKTDSARVCSPYLFQLMLSAGFQKLLADNASGSTAQGIQRKKFETLRIALPSVVEQRAIAAALSDMDALVTALGNLIAKKRDLQMAAMQQLLTGQTRLPGFRGEWKVKRLGDIFRVAVGTSKSAFIAENGNYWICDMGSVSKTGKLNVSKRTNYRGDFLAAGDLIMPKDDIGGGNIIGKVGYIDSDDTYVLSDHVYHLRVEAGDSRFLAYAINSHRTNRELRKKVIGSAQLGLGRKSVTDQEIQFPAVDEQSAIAAILWDMDAELAALEARREKTRMLKQGMMQELLTGRTRLV
jgi:type I restriction enzyme S subunit